MGRKTITFSLNEKSINQAIRELDEYRKEFVRKCNQLVKELVAHGEEVAKLEVLRLGAFDTGNLADTITGFYDEESHVGFIRANAWYAVYVEYGTGVVGNGTHPQPATGWTYDIHHHGNNGWIYWSGRDGMWHWTKGQVASPFMYNTFRTLQQAAHDYAKNIFQ